MSNNCLSAEDVRLIAMGLTLLKDKLRSSDMSFNQLATEGQRHEIDMLYQKVKGLVVVRNVEEYYEDYIQ